MMLYDRIKGNKRIPFHMPGHKRNTRLLGKQLPYEIDITEIEGFDNLHSPDGIIREIEEKAQRIYQSEHSFLLINGSTVGILAAVSTVLKRGDTVLIARNCHKSVYNAIDLVGARAKYLSCHPDEYSIPTPVDINELKLQISKHNPKMIIVTSPTYEGVCSDTEKICEIAHSVNIPVMIDAAHGAHDIGLTKNADIVVMSLHKTLPALTQCAVAHINGDLVNAEEYRIKLSVFETSSPSYVLLCSIDNCLTFLEQITEEHNFLNEFYKNRISLYDNLFDMKNLKAVQYDDYTKLIIFTGYSNISGIELSSLLRNNYSIEPEMAAEDYIVLFTTMCDDYKNYKILEKALKTIDNDLEERDYIPKKFLPIPERFCSVDKVGDCSFQELSDSVDCVCGEYIWAYPPGIPLIVPGERISRELIEYIKTAYKDGISLQSSYRKIPEKIYCQL